MKDRNTSLIIGATSDLAREVAKKLVINGENLQLVARNNILIEDLKTELNHIRADSVVDVVVYDVLNDSPTKFDAQLTRLPNSIYCFVGSLVEHDESVDSEKRISKLIQINYEGPVKILDFFAEKFESRGSGLIVAVSSVAGDRGKASNYLYGSAKAGLTCFLSGLRNRLHKSNVRVVTVKPGYIDTKMIRHLTVPRFLTVKPSVIAQHIANIRFSKQDVTYILKRWFVLVLIIKLIPERLFKKINF